LHEQWESRHHQSSRTNTLILTNVPYVKAALTAGFTNAGYVTLAFNNSPNVHQVPPALPVSVEIIQVDTNLYAGELEVISPGIRWPSNSRCGITPISRGMSPLRIPVALRDAGRRPHSEHQF